MKEQKLGRGQSILGFTSTEEMLDYVAEQEAIAIADTLPEQWEITWGDYVIRFVEPDLVVWGDLWTQEKLVESETSDDEEESRVELEQAMDSHGRGYRFGQWFSEVEPAGEYGTAHVVSLWKITKREFEIAGENDWQLWPELVYKLQAEMDAARGGSHE
jgi:hypothetical protein